MSAASEFRLGDIVCLVDRHGDIPSGARGRIIGRFAGSTDRNYIVSFEGEGAGAADVRFDQIVLAYDARTSD